MNGRKGVWIAFAACLAIIAAMAWVVIKIMSKSEGRDGVWWGRPR